MKGYRVEKAASWKTHAWRPGGPPVPEPDLLAAGVHPDVIAHLVAVRAFTPVELPDPPPAVRGVAAPAIEA